MSFSTLMCLAAYLSHWRLLRCCLDHLSVWAVLFIKATLPLTLPRPDRTDEVCPVEGAIFTKYFTGGALAVGQNTTERDILTAKSAFQTIQGRIFLPFFNFFFLSEESICVEARAQSKKKKKDYFRRHFNPSRSQAGIQCFKNTFSGHTWTLHLHAALCFTWMRAEYRLGAA